MKLSPSSVSSVLSQSSDVHSAHHDLRKRRRERDGERERDGRVELQGCGVLLTDLSDWCSSFDRDCNVCVCVCVLVLAT